MTINKINAKYPFGKLLDISENYGTRNVNYP